MASTNRRTAMMEININLLPQSQASFRRMRHSQSSLPIPARKLTFSEIYNLHYSGTRVLRFLFVSYCFSAELPWEDSSGQALTAQL